MLMLYNLLFCVFCCCCNRAECAIYTDKGGTYQAIARFQDSNLFQTAITIMLIYIFTMVFHLSGFKLYSCSTHRTIKFLNWVEFWLFFFLYFQPFLSHIQMYFHQNQLSRHFFKRHFIDVVNKLTANSVIK